MKLEAVKYAIRDSDNRTLAYIEYCGMDKWAIRNKGECLDFSGNWNYEPSPSNRTKEWLAINRHPSPGYALEFYDAYLKQSEWRGLPCESLDT